MKYLLTFLLFCIIFAAKSQQLPKSEPKNLFIGKYNFDTFETVMLPQVNVRPSIRLDKKIKANDSFLNSSNFFKNKVLLASSIKYNMPLLDTKNDNSRSIILKPDSSFKSNMPIIRKF